MAIAPRRVPRLGKQAKPGDNARKVMTARADARAADLAPIVVELRAAGTTSLRGIAAALNARGIQTPRGVGRWKAGSVSQPRLAANQNQLLAAALKLKSF